MDRASCSNKIGASVSTSEPCLKNIMTTYSLLLSRPSKGPEDPNQQPSGEEEILVHFPVDEIWKGLAIRLEDQKKEVDALHQQVKIFISNSLHALESLAISDGGVFEWKRGHFTSIKNAKLALCRLTEMAIELENCKAQLEVEKDLVRSKTEIICLQSRELEGLRRIHQN